MQCRMTPNHLGSKRWIGLKVCIQSQYLVLGVHNAHWVPHKWIDPQFNRSLPLEKLFDTKLPSNLFLLSDSSGLTKKRRDWALWKFILFFVLVILGSSSNSVKLLTSYNFEVLFLFAIISYWHTSFSYCKDDGGQHLCPGNNHCLPCRLLHTCCRDQLCPESCRGKSRRQPLQLHPCSLSDCLGWEEKLFLI